MNVYTLVTITLIKIEHVHHSKSFLIHFPSQTLSPKITTLHIFITVDWFCFSLIHINGIIQYMLFWYGFFHLPCLWNPSTSLHASLVHLFITEHNFIVLIYHNLFIHSLNGYLDCFQFEEYYEYAARNIIVQAILWTYVFIS